MSILLSERALETETLARQLRILEDVIEVRMNLFFENLTTVEDLLALANATDGAAE